MRAAATNSAKTEQPSMKHIRNNHNHVGEDLKCTDGLTEPHPDTPFIQSCKLVLLLARPQSFVWVGWPPCCVFFLLLFVRLLV
jgi:hypothetical protein